MVFVCDGDNGFSKNQEVPWDNEENAAFSRTLTLGRTGEKNAVIVGRVTYETMIRRPLTGRQTYVVSRTWKQEDHQEVRVFASVRAALEAAHVAKMTNVFVYGGAALFEEITTKWLYLCDRVYATKLKNKYQCDVTFPWASLEPMDLARDPVKTNIHTRYEFISAYGHRETQVLEAAEKLLSDPKNEGLSERHLLGVAFEFDLSRTFPVLTTNYVDFGKVLKTFVFAFSGASDARALARQGVDSFSAATSVHAQEVLGHGYLEGDMGPWWGWVMRHYGETYKSCDATAGAVTAGSDDETDELPGVPAVDQLSLVLTSLRQGSSSGTIYLTSPSYVKLVVPNRYQSVSFYLSKDRRTLDTVFNVLSSECVDELGVDVATGGLFGVVMATLLQVRSGAFHVHVNDLWVSRTEPLKKMAGRTPLPFPKLLIRDATRFLTLASVTNDSFIFTQYEHHTTLTSGPATKQPEQLIIRRRKVKGKR
jgi:dihydrofolate reductase/thymidylate synthase